MVEADLSTNKTCKSFSSRSALAAYMGCFDVYVEQWLRWAQNKEAQTSMCITYSSTKPPDHPPAFGASSFSLRITLSSHNHLPCTPNSSQLCSSAQETNGLIRSLNWYLEFQPSDLPKIALTPPCVLCNTVTSAHSQVPRLTCFLNPASAL